MTALLVQTSGRVQLAFNLAALAVVAPPAERRLGAVWMPVVFLLSGAAAHAVSTAGRSVHGGGDSVGSCGLVGALATSYALSGRQRPLRLLSAFVPAAGAVPGAAFALVPQGTAGRLWPCSRETCTRPGLTRPCRP
ncbi:rhomboid family intramembrane serine protease [Streptomyces chattanoogensis]|uniref:rhomboid family intramembrane serine protease n=1 Tax=Streptomyces chattanoogensis TaxID=66876 RepID=UPI000A4BA060|nr:rhomboid family intramembrane serine protease [Streptomyces chattanoogensis]